MLLFIFFFDMLRSPSDTTRTDTPFPSAALFLCFVHLFTWISSSTLEVDWALRFDTLTAVMVFVVNVISSMVHVYSVGYMSHDPHKPRFMAYLSLFTFFMLALVTADNFVQMFFGWEGVGLASYLLIGFWYHRPAANAAAIKAFVVNVISSMVLVYSVGFRSHDPNKPRFKAYLSLFTFVMLALVTADNFVQMFFGWEGVGLASYLLIGFWYHRPAANAAAIKAFVVNRIGDFGFIIGIMGVFFAFGSLDFGVVFAAVPGVAGQTFGFLGMELDTVTTLCFLLFIGAMGKSAQLGLHTWL